MRLLITTQIVDEKDPGLGFFCHWLAEFAQHFEHIEVICLKEGTHTLPKNVRVHSLGKEKGGNRLVYALRFTKLAWKLRRDYDAVFVHMNPEYILLAADQWLLGRKKIALWYNHTVGSLALRVAAPITSIVFHTSPFAYTARYKNAVQMPAGIDTELFKSTGAPRTPLSIYMQGRVAPAKRVHVLLEALRLLRHKGIPARATIVGPEQSEYGQKLRVDFSDLLSVDAVEFLGPKQNEETPALYSSSAAAVNLASAGNFDKTALEPMACGTPLITSSTAFADIVGEEWVVPENDGQALASALERLFALREDERARIGGSQREAVCKRHSLASLAERLTSELSSA